MCESNFLSLLVVGGVTTLFLSRLISGLLFQVRPMDPLSLLAAVSVVTAATVVAAWVPAYRASRGNPMAALRGE